MMVVFAGNFQYPSGGGAMGLLLQMLVAKIFDKSGKGKFNAQL